MRIAFLNAYGNGSTGRIVDSLKEVCEKNGNQVMSIFSREVCARNDSTTVRCFNKLGFFIDGLLTRLFDNHGLNNWGNTKTIIKTLRHFNPDIIHIHNLHGYWINFPMLINYVNESHVKVIWTFHDCWHFTGHCTHFDFVQCEKWKTGCNHCSQLKEYPSSLGFDGSARNYMRKKRKFRSIDNMIIVTPSEWLKSKVEESFLNKYEIRVINNGIDTTVFKPSDNIELRSNTLKKGFKKIVLGVAASWNERKGLKDILEVAAKEKEWYFVIIGAIPSVTEVSLDQPNVLHLNRTEDVQVLCDWYSVADVFVNPTLEDTYPTTNLEAIACGTPVVTYATGGSEEIVRTSGYGIVTAERNSKSLHDSILSIFNNMPVLNPDFNLRAEDKYAEYLQLYMNI